MEAQARRVDFAEVAGPSVVSIVAARVGAGATAALLQEAIESLDFPGLDEKPSSITAQPQTLARIVLAVAGDRYELRATVWEYQGFARTTQG
jgi:hypothetical protein